MNPFNRRMMTISSINSSNSRPMSTLALLKVRRFPRLIVSEVHFDVAPQSTAAALNPNEPLCVSPVLKTKLVGWVLHVLNGELLPRVTVVLLACESNPSSTIRLMSLIVPCTPQQRIRTAHTTAAYCVRHLTLSVGNARTRHLLLEASPCYRSLSKRKVVLNNGIYC